MVPTNLPLFSNLTPSKVKDPNTLGRCPTPFLVISQVTPVVMTVFWSAPSLGLLETLTTLRGACCHHRQCVRSCRKQVFPERVRTSARPHGVTSAFLRSRQCSCSNGTITSRPVTSCFFYISPSRCVPHVRWLQGRVTHHYEYHALIIFITSCFGRLIRPSAGSRWNS
jgi:hypothetical protein